MAKHEVSFKPADSKKFFDYLQAHNFQGNYQLETGNLMPRLKFSKGKRFFGLVSSYNVELMHTGSGEENGIAVTGFVLSGKRSGYLEDLRKDLESLAKS